MGRVFITNNVGHDYSKAEKFGALVNVTEGNVNIFNPDSILADIEERLDGFDPDQDCLLIAGNSLVGALSLLAVNNLMDRIDPTPVRLILFDARKRDYFARTIEL